MKDFPKTEILKKIEWLQDVFVARREELSFEVDESIKEAFLEVIAELEALQNKTCDSCKHCPRLVSAINPFCIIHNYWLTEESSKILSCNRYEPKDKQ